MTHPRRLAVGSLVVLGVLVGGAFLARTGRAGEGQGEGQAEGEGASRAEVAALFGERCASCHEAPDPGFAVDRAWIDQVHRTA